MSTTLEMEEPPKPRRDYHGVLAYRRESGWGVIPCQPASATDHTVNCEFCGAQAKPPLDFSKTPVAEDFCCTQYMEMFKKVEQQWRSLQEQDENNGEESRDKTKDMLKQAAEEYLSKSKKSSQTEIPGCKVTSSGLFTTINFRLSDLVRMKENETLKKKDGVLEDKFGPSSTSSNPAGFGLYHYQGHIRKFYVNGEKFLTALPDGAAQVFYPSGNLAISAFIDDTVGVCIVLEDIKSSCPIRAFFQSNGISSCYHSSGGTWLHMDMWGGWCLNEDRSKRRKWKWMDYTHTPTLFKPIHLSLNKNIGVRVLGQGSVIVSFLASREQARFSVGSCVEPSDPKPSLCKEDLMLQATQLNARLALERLRLTLHSNAKLHALRFPPCLVSQARRLLKLSSNIWMEEEDREYIQHCVRDCQ